jgi:hypothetical protein
MRAIRYEILRYMVSDTTASVPLPNKPLAVATLISESMFKASGGLMLHEQTVHLEQQFSDWSWHQGRLSYHSRAASAADVLVVYELARPPEPAPAMSNLFGHAGFNIDSLALQQEPVIDNAT